MIAIQPPREEIIQPFTPSMILARVFCRRAPRVLRTSSQSERERHKKRGNFCRFQQYPKPQIICEKSLFFETILFLFFVWLLLLSLSLSLCVPLLYSRHLLKGATKHTLFFFWRRRRKSSRHKRNALCFFFFELLSFSFGSSSGRRRSSVLLLFLSSTSEREREKHHHPRFSKVDKRDPPEEGPSFDATRHSRESTFF